MKQMTSIGEDYVKQLKKAANYVWRTKKIRFLLLGVLAILLIIQLKQWLTPKPIAEPIGGQKITLTTQTTDTSQPVTKKASTTQKTTESTDTMTLVKSADSLVKQAYKKTQWQPLPTKQTEPHQINFNSGSIDREEMRQAMAHALELPSNQLEEWWLDMTSPTQIIGYLENRQTKDVYRVTIDWQKNQGYKPALVEELYELPTSFK